MNQPMFSKYLLRGVVALCMLLPGCSNKVEEHVAESQVHGSAKNLLLICIDTVRADVFYRLGDLQKDSLSDWQSDALVFTRASSAAPWTLPSVGSVFTGLWPVQHGIGQLPGARKNVTHSIPSSFYKDTPLLALAAEKQGFRTAAFTANGWTFADWRSKGLVEGFDVNQKFPPDVKNLGETVWPRMVDAWRKVFIEDTSKGPALHFLHFMEAHNWHTMPAEQKDERLATLTAEQRTLFRSLAPEKACEDEQSESCKSFIIYVSAVSALREGVATILETLKKEGLLQDTIVVLFADHGEEFLDHVGDDDPEQAPGVRLHIGHGFNLYEELLHVPLVIWHPGYKGKTITQLVDLIDIAPTAARWLGIDFMPDQWQGRFLDESIDHPDEKTDRVIFASNISYGEPQISVRQGDKKGIWYTLSNINHYFDLGRDPLERKSVAPGDLVLLFDGYYLDYARLRPHKEVESGKLSKDQIKRLKSIGYLQGIEADDADE